MSRWGRYFSSYEFQCKCGCGTLNVDPRLVKWLDEFRAWLGDPVRITSGCRCPLYNRRIGGARKSHHIATVTQPAEAADIAVEGLDSKSLMTLVEQYDPNGRYFRGRGLYKGKGFVHLDIHWTLGVRRWIAYPKGSGGYIYERVNAFM